MNILLFEGFFSNLAQKTIDSAKNFVAGLHTDGAGQPGLAVGSASEFVHGIGLPFLGNLNRLDRALPDAGITIGAILLPREWRRFQRGLR